MGLPQIPEFAGLLRSLSLTKKADSESVEIFPQEFATDGQTHVARDRAISVWYIPTQISWEALVRRVQGELRAKEHKDSVSLAHALIGVYCLHPKKEEAPVESFNSILDLIVDARLTQFFILPLEPPATLRRFSFGPFAVGALDLPKLESRSRKAGSDYHRLYGHSHMGKLTIERGVVPARMVDLRELRMLLDQHGYDKQIWNREVHGYFSALSKEYFEDFWSDFVESQSLPLALGAPYLGPDIFKLIPRSSSVAIFRTETGGHVAPHFAPAVRIDFGSADKTFNQVQAELESAYAFDGFTSSNWHRTLRSYISFVGRAKRHPAAGHLDEGFLHHIIALDLVFGGQELIGRTVSERVAMIVHKPLGLEFDAAVRLMNQAYSVRSKYVHEGQAVDLNMNADVERVTREVTLCLLRLQRDSSRELSVDRWLANLDYFVKAVRAEKGLSTEELRENGIAMGES